MARRWRDATWEPLAGSHPSVSELEIGEATRLAASGDTIIADAPFLPSLLGLAEPSVKGVAVPVVSDGSIIGTLYTEVNQTHALESLTRAFSVVAMVTVGLAVLAIIAVLAALGGRGLTGEAKGSIRAP